ncbi:MAG: T9SS type A sorting domain-containing protein [Saprospiraceae bacterium]|nr:T9SS type A sorting domain-containing protein [Saprospiraceae bacterium]
MLRLFTLPCFLGLTTVLFAQTPQDAVVPLQLSAGLNPPAVSLSWSNPQASDLILRRRIKGAAGDSWVELLNVQETLLNGHFDNGLDGSQVYEYALERKTGSITAYGYGFANFFTPVVDQRGKLLVFIDSTTADALGADLITFKNNLRGEGWETVPFKTGPSTTPQWIKSQIVEAYTNEPNLVKSVLLMGSVPVPYSGSMAWDNQPDHVGAWPCDAYYGDVDGVWTDQNVNLPNTTRAANRNVPGDGKFDQNILPSAVELPVGRLDFRRLSAATFGDSPVELLRKYLHKNHLWRTGQYKVPQRALVDDHLGWAGGEAFAADGYRNAIPLVGESNVVAGNFINSDRFLLGYGTGFNGTYSSAGGIGSAADFSTDSVRMVFANLFGDYFGDWDAETNPLMPALLASKGGVLAVSWAGRPHWMQQGLATGETIGYCLKETQNAQFNTAYGPSNGQSGAHVALLGDPTLRAKVVPPVRDLTVVSNCDRVNLNWKASSDPEVVAYLVYRSVNHDGPYTRVTPDLIFQTSWADLSPLTVNTFYSVRGVKLEVTPGGGAFYNTSAGAPQSVLFVPGTGPTAIALGGQLDCNTPSLTLGTNFTPPGSAVQWYKPNGEALSGFTATEAGVYTVVVTAANGCTTAAYATVYLDTLLPQIDFPGLWVLNCFTTTISYTVPSAPPNIQYFYNGTEVFPGQNLALANGAVFRVHSTANGCSRDYPVTIQVDADAPFVQINHSGLFLDCNTPSLELQGESGTNVQYAWALDAGPVFSTSQQVEVNVPGNYCLTVTGLNGCSSSSCVVVSESVSVLDVTIELMGNPCEADPKTLTANVSTGVGPYEYLWSTGGTAASESLPQGFSGNVTVSVTDANDCMAATSIVVGIPLEVIALSDEETTPGAADGHIELLVLNGVLPMTYLWSNGSTTEDIFDLVNGTYTVTITSGNGCSTVLSISLFATGVEETIAESNVRIFPNPATDQFRVTFEKQPLEPLQLHLLNASGQRVATQTGNAADFYFNTALLPPGQYLLWMGSQGKNRVYPMIIH